MDPSLQEKQAALAGVPIFSRLPPRSLRKLARHCIPRRYSRGTAIVEEGSPGLGMFLITAGRVEVTKSADGREIPLAVLGEGEVLGEMALIDDRPRSATAVALEETACLLLTRDSFRTLLEKQPKIAWPIVPSLAERVRDLQEMLIDAEASAATAAPAEEPVTRAAQREIEVAVRPQAEIVAVEEPDPAVQDLRQAPPPTLDPREPEATTSAAEESEPMTLTPRESVNGSGEPSLGALLLRAQVGFFLSGAVGVSESARLMETFCRSLADETRLDEVRDLKQLFQGLPRGMITAAAETWKEGREVPARMLATLFRPMSRRRG